ncbi:MAG: hypothetical protein QOD13_2734 [Thermoleophilaceae bacterium]|jgi:hypothetical protein|nr:hypothetical protein [Thermoleophilaceae bacterium]
MAYSTGRRSHRDKCGPRLRASTPRESFARCRRQKSPEVPPEQVAAGHRDLGDKGADQRVPLLEDLGFAA